MQDFASREWLSALLYLSFILVGILILKVGGSFRHVANIVGAGEGKRAGEAGTGVALAAGGGGIESDF